MAVGNDHSHAVQQDKPTSRVQPMIIAMNSMSPIITAVNSRTLAVPRAHLAARPTLLLLLCRMQQVMQCHGRAVKI